MSLLCRGNGFYPGTGDIDDVGEGAGRGFNLNIPFPRGGFNDADYIAAFDLVGMLLLLSCWQGAQVFPLQLNILHAVRPVSVRGCQRAPRTFQLAHSPLYQARLRGLFTHHVFRPPCYAGLT